MSTFGRPSSPVDLTGAADALSWGMNSASHEQNDDTGTRPKYRVLIIDDDPHIARLIRENLIRGGLEARVACNGVSGLQEFQDHPPHLVLLDLMMPVVDGFEVYDDIRRQSLVPIVIMTARLEPIQHLNNFRREMDDYVLKPFDPELLVVRIIAHLRRLYRCEQRHIYRKDDLELNPEAAASEID